MKHLSAVALLLALSVLPAHAQRPALDSELCRAQLDLLQSGEKLTEDETSRFETQCDCLEARERGETDGTEGNCAEV